MVNIGMLLIGLGIILVSAELFTNGIEWLGRRMKLSEGAVGSILAAVGTALPETLVPVIAIGLGTSQAATEIGVGAILGAPFMLGTLALFVTGAAALIFALFGRRRATMMIDNSVMKRDLKYFLVIYSIAILAALLSSHLYKLILAVGLIAAYILYVYKTITSGEYVAGGDLKPLLLQRTSAIPRFRFIMLQVLMAVGGIICGAELFVHSMEKLAVIMDIAPFILSVVITPVATELPEKFNSIIWVSRGKDTLALGNITGAMVFQSSIIPAIGILMTPWVLNKAAFTCALVALSSAAMIYVFLSLKGYLRAYTLLSGGVFYSLFLFLIIGHKI
ncbi:sodium:calcium antiporter [Phosphitispora sp. TUW77]|uniref:sodium:calcium antiporter n=1 Tax=Phosphitispora sp. TUW77 TaxID=3152361 RepID=UPI003AB44A51